MQALDKALAQVGRVVLGKEEQLKLFHRLTRSFAEERARAASGVSGGILFESASAAGQTAGWLNAWEKLAKQRREQESLYLDPKQSVMNALYTLRDAAAA